MFYNMKKVAGTKKYMYQTADKYNKILNNYMHNCIINPECSITYRLNMGHCWVMNVLLITRSENCSRPTALVCMKFDLYISTLCTVRIYY